MKGNNLKTLTIILAIVLVTLVGFFGIYTHVQNRMENQVKDYSYTADINGARKIQLKVSEETTEENQETEGETTTEETGDSSEAKKKNPEEVRTVENYKLSKEIIDKRLKDLKVQDYIVRLDETTGDMWIEIPENTTTDDIISNLTTTGKFEIIDADTEEVLLNNDDIENAQILYGSASSASTGTSVYLSIQFDKEGTKKFDEITRTYTKGSDDSENGESENTTESETTEGQDNTTNTENTESTDSSEESKEKQVKLKINDEEILSTSFEQPISNGLLQLTYGQESSENETINENAQKANQVALLLKNGKLPIEYEVETNQYILSDITQEKLQVLEIIVAVIALIALAILIIRYRLKGLLSAISYIGLTALLLLTIRYTNVMLSIEGLLAITIVMILNYIFTNKLLNLNKKETIKESIKQTYINFFIKIIPVIIMSIVFCFINWTSINTFGMVMFWGITLIAIYNYLITGTLLKLQKAKTTKKTAGKGGTGNGKKKNNK